MNDLEDVRETSPLLKKDLPVQTQPIQDPEQDASSPDAEDLSTARLVMTIGSGYLGIFLAALDGTMVATLTASISASYNSMTLLAWLASAYFIATSILQPLAGKLTDIYGRRAGLVVCHVLFGLGNLICGTAQGEATILLGRIVAGLGGGGLNAIPLFVTNDLVPLRRRGIWQGFNNVCFGLGAGFGGTFGGLVNDSLGWRYAFLIVVPLTIISGTLVSLFMKTPVTVTVKEAEVKEKWRRIDFLGSITLVTAIFLLCTALNSGGNTVPWNHPVVLVSLPLSVILFLIFGYVEANIAVEPVIPVRLFLNRTVVSGCLTNWFFSMSQVALTFYAPIYFQVQGMSATQAGLRLIPTSVGAALGGVVGGVIMRATGKYYVLNLTMLALFLIALGLTMRLDLDSPEWLPIVYFFFTGFAYAGKLTVTVTALIAAVEQKNHALVTSAAYAFRSTGSTIGITVGSLVFQNILLSRLWDHFGGRKDSADLIERLRNSLKEMKDLDIQTGREVQEVYMEALRGVFTTLFGLAVLGAVAGLFLREHILHKDLARRRS